MVIIERRLGPPIHHIVRICSPKIKGNIEQDWKNKFDQIIYGYDDGEKILFVNKELIFRYYDELVFKKSNTIVLRPYTSIVHFKLPKKVDIMPIRLVVPIELEKRDLLVKTDTRKFKCTRCEEQTLTNIEYTINQRHKNIKNAILCKYCFMVYHLNLSKCAFVPVDSHCSPIKIPVEHFKTPIRTLLRRNNHYENVAN